MTSKQYKAIPLCLESEAINIKEAKEDIYINGDPRIPLEERRKTRIHASLLELSKDYILPLCDPGAYERERVIDSVQDYAHPNTLFVIESLGFNRDKPQNPEETARNSVVLDLAGMGGKIEIELKPQRIQYFKIYELLILSEANYNRRSYWDMNPEEFRSRIAKYHYHLGDKRVRGFFTKHQGHLRDILRSVK